MSEESSITCVEAVSQIRLIARLEQSADPNARQAARQTVEANL